MGALKGSIAVRRYKVLDPLPADSRKKLTKAIRAHAFLPLDPASDLDRSSGWVSMLDGEDADLEQEKLFFVATGGEHLRMALRLDVLKPPRSEVKRQAATRAAELADKEGRELSRRERRSVEEEVARKLRLRAFPRVRIVDLVWNLDAGKLWLWSQTKAANELFVDLFARSFAMKIDVDGPERWTRLAGEEKAVAKLEPTPELWQGFAGVRPLAIESSDGEEA